MSLQILKNIYEIEDIVVNSVVEPSIKLSVVKKTQVPQYSQ